MEMIEISENLSKVKPSCSREKKIQVKKPTQSCYQEEGFRPRQPVGSHKISTKFSGKERDLRMRGN